MANATWQGEIAKRVWLAQLIVAAMLCGVLTFLAIALVLVQFSVIPAITDTAPLMTVVLLAFAAGAVGARIIVPQRMASQARRKIREGTWQLPQTGSAQAGTIELLERTGDAGKLWVVYMARTIVSVALTEGIAFFACVAYLTEQSLVALGVAVVMAAWIAVRIPTKAGAIYWIERQLQLMEEERLLSR